MCFTHPEHLLRAEIENADREERVKEKEMQYFLRTDGVFKVHHYNHILNC